MKPTYEELEQQLAESHRALRAETTAHDHVKNQLEKMAAENGQMLRLLTDISENHEEYVNQDEYLYAGVPMDYVSEINAYVSRDVEAENPFKETDAYLAEVRAQGADECVRQLVISDDDDFCDAPNVCAMVAHQLRKGVQS